MVNRILKRIPGELPPPSKKENQGYIEDLGKLQTFQLNELLERQDKLLAKKSFVFNLPDKGEKIKMFRDKLNKEIERRNEIDEAARLLSKLNIAENGKLAVNQMEWTGKYSEKDGEKIVELDSDDEEDPLKILAQPTGSGVHRKKVIQLPPEESLIKPEDLEINSLNSIDTSNLEHVKHIINIIENPKNLLKKEKFMPYKTTKSNVHDPMVEKMRKKDEHWEVTAATPPLIVHGAAKCLSISESLRLQKEHAEKLQEIQIKRAADRLRQQLGIYNLGSLPNNLGNYRSNNDINDSDSLSNSENEENEVLDE